MRQTLGKAAKRLAGIWFEKRLARIETEARLSKAFSRAAATAATRVLDPMYPLSWEFSGFSQHGEDGIIDYLCSRLVSQNYYFMEIGAADGLENCSSWLAFARGYGGVMVEGDANLSRRCRDLLHERVWNVQPVNLMVDCENIQSLMKLCPYKDLDVFILDIDGTDYYVCERILELGYRPRIVVVEYNSAFGPERPTTVVYEPGFSRWKAHPSGLYYGASIGAWRVLFGRHGYHFVTVESTGCNAVFLDPGAFNGDFVEGLRGVRFRENTGDGSTRPYVDASGDLVMPARDWQSQFKLLRDIEFVDM